MILALLTFECFALAQEVSDDALSEISPVEKEVKKTLPSKSFVRQIGSRSYSAPGIKKQVALAQTAKAFAPGQMKKTAGVASAKLFARKPGEAEARKKQIFESLAKKAMPQKRRLTKAEYRKSPLKGKHIPQRPK